MRKVSKLGDLPDMVTVTMSVATGAMRVSEKRCIFSEVGAEASA